jgi:hypothetical protein
MANLIKFSPHSEKFEKYVSLEMCRITSEVGKCYVIQGHFISENLIREGDQIVLITPSCTYLHEPPTCMRTEGVKSYVFSFSFMFYFSFLVIGLMFHDVCCVDAAK